MLEIPANLRETSTEFLVEIPLQRAFQEPDLVAQFRGFGNLRGKRGILLDSDYLAPHFEFVFRCKCE